MNKKLIAAQKKVIDDVMKSKLPLEIKKSQLEYMLFRRELTLESDRGCALLAAAHLDFMLETFLRKKLLGNKKHHEILFGVNGPLGTFSSRIALTYSIGHFSANSLHDIQIIRKIRNDFGHSPSILNFDNEKIKNQCNSFLLTVYDKEAKARTKFLNVVSAISGELEAEIFKCSQFAEKSNLDLQDRKEWFEAYMTKLKKMTEPSPKRKTTPNKSIAASGAEQ